MRLKNLLILLCFLMISASSCILNKDDLPSSSSAFEDVVWKLQYYRKSTAVEDVPATITFSDGEVSGSTGCNHFSGHYQIEGNDTGRLSISDLAITEMYCLEPAGLVEQEEFFIQTLSNAQRFEFTPDRLMIYQDGHEALTFTPVES